MEAELFYGPTAAPASRRGQIAAAAGRAFKDRTNEAERAIKAARADLRNKLRLAYRVPYHEWEKALAAGDYAIGTLLERYGQKHCPAPSPAGLAYRAEQGRLESPSERAFSAGPLAARLP